MQKINRIFLLLFFVIASSVLGRVTNVTDVDPLNVIGNYLSGVTVNAHDAQTDSIKVLALRVEFQADDLQTTTGNGTFDLSTDSDYLIDLPPHNKTYFEHQILAMSNYFKHVSNGRVLISGDVWPKDENASYKLENDMVYYSGTEDEELKKTRWSELLNDALKVCEAQESSIDFSDYDVVMIFHAGVGSDFSFDFDQTPFDIQSVFIDFETLAETYADGISVGNATFKEAIILPETQCQEDYNLGLLGTMTLLMGSQMGMPALYDTDQGRAGIGRWGLMDQGSYNFQGLVPAEPCAWTKVFMGWEQPQVVNTSNLVPIAVSSSDAAPHIYKIPINQNEYFLLENRQRDTNKDGYAFGYDEKGTRVQIDSTGKVSVEENIGVITKISEYDFGLPGSGILVWHIDDNVIREKLASGTINNDINHRGVDLVESDGAQDLGYFYSLLDAAYGAESGDYFDPYWADNISHQYVNDTQSTEIVELSSKTIPNSRANDGSDSHIRIYDFSHLNQVMTFAVENEWHLDGFPKYVGKGFASTGLKKFTELTPKDKNSRDIFFGQNQHGQLFKWYSDGNAYVEKTDSITITSIYGDKKLPYELFFENVGSVSQPVTEFYISENLADSLHINTILVNDAGKVFYIPFDAKEISDVYTVDLGDKPTSPPFMYNWIGPDTESTTHFGMVIGIGNKLVTVQMVNGKLVKTGVLDQLDGNVVGFSSPSKSTCWVTTSTGQLYLFQIENDIFTVLKQIDLGLTAEQVYSIPVVAHNFYRSGYDQEYVFILSNRGDLILLTPDGEIVNKNRARFRDNVTSLPVVSDVDGDKSCEIVVNTLDYVYAFELTGVVVENFPISISHKKDNQNMVASPSIISVETSFEGYSGSIIVTGDDNGKIHALKNNGKELEGFPISTGAACVSAPILWKDNVSNLGIAIISDDGYLYAWNMPSPQEFGVDEFDNILGSVDPSTVPHPSIRATMFENDKVEKTLVSSYCYPNPTSDVSNIRYRLGQQAQNVSVRIYDIAGFFVEELTGTGTSIGDHEIAWDVSNISSGAYIARIDIETDSENSVEFIKIAVVK